eukprot:scaffold1916_cov123-Isochrysis_galbana.AAC.19
MPAPVPQRKGSAGGAYVSEGGRGCCAGEGKGRTRPARSHCARAQTGALPTRAHNETGLVLRVPAAFPTAASVPSPAPDAGHPRVRAGGCPRSLLRWPDQGSGQLEQGGLRCAPFPARRASRPRRAADPATAAPPHVCDTWPVASKRVRQWSMIAPTRCDTWPRGCPHACGALSTQTTGSLPSGASQLPLSIAVSAWWRPRMSSHGRLLRPGHGLLMQDAGAAGAPRLIDAPYSPFLAIP